MKKLNFKDVLVNIHYGTVAIAFISMFLFFLILLWSVSFGESRNSSGFSPVVFVGFLLVVIALAMSVLGLSGSLLAINLKERKIISAGGIIIVILLYLVINVALMLYPADSLNKPDKLLFEIFRSILLFPILSIFLGFLTVIIGKLNRSDIEMAM